MTNHNIEDQTYNIVRKQIIAERLCNLGYIYVPVYGQVVLIAYDLNAAKYAAKNFQIEGIEQTLEELEYGTLKGCAGNRRDCLLPSDDKAVKAHVILLREPDMSVLVHELLHVTHNILDYVQVGADYDNDEAQTYLFDYLFEWATKGFYSIEYKETPWKLKTEGSVDVEVKSL